MKTLAIAAVGLALVLVLSVCGPPHRLAGWWLAC